MKPSILIIIFDSMRCDHLGCYGYPIQTTPVMENLLPEFVKFENTVSQAHWTLPSHATIFTGLYPSQHGMIHSSAYLPTGTPTLAGILHECGYQTVGLSQNIYVGPKSGLQAGFSTFLGWDHLRANKSAFDRNIVTKELRETFKRLGLVTDEFGKRWGSSLTIEAAQHWLTREWRPRKPFFMFINLMDCHWPVYPPRPFRRKVGVTNFDRNTYKNRWSLQRFIACPEEVTSQIKSTWSSLYDAAIMHLDSLFSRLYDCLRKNKILDDTLLILTSDHGEAFGEHGLFGHSPGLYDCLVRVPLLIRFPYGRFKSTKYPYIVELRDIFSTVLDVTGVDWKGDRAGTSLSGLLEEPMRSRCAFSERYPMERRVFEEVVRHNQGRDFSWHLQTQRSVRSLTHKFIWSSDGKHEFFDLIADPLEECNLLTVPDKDGQFPTKEELQAQLELWMDSLEAKITPEDRAVEDVVVKERLRALGYIE